MVLTCSGGEPESPGHEHARDLGGPVSGLLGPRVESCLEFAGSADGERLSG
jgi:hypothetical protein